MPICALSAWLAKISIVPSEERPVSDDAAVDNLERAVRLDLIGFDDAIVETTEIMREGAADGRLREFGARLAVIGDASRNRLDIAGRNRSSAAGKSKRQHGCEEGQRDLHDGLRLRASSARYTLWPIGLKRKAEFLVPPYSLNVAKPTTNRS